MQPPLFFLKAGAIQVTDPKYEVTGELTPDATGTYQDAGEYKSKRSYQRAPDGFFIWWDGIDTWTISAILGYPGVEYWTRTDPNIVGVYALGGVAIGIPTVTEI